MDPARPLSRRDRGPSPFRGGLLVVATLTTLLALWLVMVSVTVLPARDPSHVRFWRVVAGGLLLFAALTFAYIGRPVRTPLGLGAMRVGSGLALALSLPMLVGLLRGSVRFEGYLLVMAVIIAAHGLLGLVDTYCVVVTRETDAPPG